MKKNNLIYFTAFFCGMSVMAVELSATRLLAPYFGTSQIVWTVVIGLIMISLSLGNILGGRAADKYNNMDKLYSLIWIASLWIAVIPLVGKYIITLSSFMLMWILPDNLIVGGSVISCLVVFSFPLVILGMASPYLVKLGVQNMANNGKTTGEIYALSTIGSIIGTFIPTFLTIPVVGTSKTFYIFALVLNLICLYFFITTKTKQIRSVISSIIIVVLIFAPLNNSYAFWEKNVKYEGESLYNYLQIKEDSDSVILSTNVAFGVQSIYKKNGSLSGYYYDYALLAPLFIKNTDFTKGIKVLVLGMGTGTYAKQTKRFFTNSKIDGVEIDQKIVDLSKRYFELKDNEANIYVNDGRTFLSGKNAGKYDVIMIDAYHDITIPFHMSTAEFFDEVKKHLNPDGVIVMNINIRSSKNTELIDYLAQTVKHEMNKVYKFEIPNGTNTIVFSSDDQNCMQNYLDNIKAIDKGSILYDVTKNISNNLNEITQSQYVLTDEIAPVEVMGQKVLDEIVGDSLNNFKKQIDFSKGGLKGLFDLISG